MCIYINYYDETRSMEGSTRYMFCVYAYCAQFNYTLSLTLRGQSAVPITLSLIVLFERLCINVGTRFRHRLCIDPTSMWRLVTVGCHGHWQFLFWFTERESECTLTEWHLLWYGNAYMYWPLLAYWHKRSPLPGGRTPENNTYTMYTIQEQIYISSISGLHESRTRGLSIKILNIEPIY